MKHKRIDVEFVNEKLIEKHGKFLTLENIDSINFLNIYTGEDNIGRKWIFTDKQIKDEFLQRYKDGKIK